MRHQGIGVSASWCHGIGYTATAFRNNNAFVGVLVLMLVQQSETVWSIHHSFPLAYLRAEDRRFDIKLKEEGRSSDPRWFPRFLGGVAVTLTGCMKTQDCRSARVCTV